MRTFTGSQGLGLNFYTMLGSYKAALEPEKKSFNAAKSFAKLLAKIWLGRPAFQFVFTIIFLLLGFGIGHFLPTSNPGKKIGIS
jgi:hypothetical protein